MADDDRWWDVAAIMAAIKEWFEGFLAQADLLPERLRDLRRYDLEL